MESSEKKPKTILEAEQTVLNRKGEKTALKESERIMSTRETVFLRDLKDKGIEAIQKNHLDVWVVSQLKGVELHKFANQFNEIEDVHNKEVRASEDDERREYRFWQQDFGDLRYGLKDKFGRLEMIREIPEIIIIQAEKGEHDSTWTGVPKLVKESVDQCAKNLYRFLDDEIVSHLGENLCCPISNKFDFQKAEISQDSVIEYGLMNLEMIHRELQRDLFEKYILTKDEKYLHKFFSDNVLSEIYQQMCVFDKDEMLKYADYFWGNTSEEGNNPDNESEFFAQFKVEVDHKKKRTQWQAEQDALKKSGGEVNEFDDYDWEGEEVYPAIENYLNYRESIAEFSKNLSFDEIKERMRSFYVAAVKNELDKYASEYIRDLDTFEAEKKLLKPVLVLLSENPVQRELMRDFGAEIVLEKISADEINDLLELVGKIKSSSSSLMPEKLRRIKSEFYKSVEEKLDARSEITAETEKEIEILHEIFQNVGDVKKVLDIACGNGRIDIPLLEKGYEVTGVDANEKFLQSALRKVLEKNLAGAQFKKGDVIDYRGVVESGSQDAVIYTWHSILEAFGVGNLLHTLGNSWSVLRPGGVLVFDQPTRENPHMEDGWYGNDPDGEHQYLSYIMEEDEIRFILKMAGFENVEIRKWKTKPSEEYPDGMNKFTVSARKPDVSEDAKNATRMYRDIAAQADWVNKEKEISAESDKKWLAEYEKRKSA